MQALIGHLPEEQQCPAEMLVAGATEFLREHPVTLLVGQHYSCKVTGFVREASLLWVIAP